MSEQTLGLTGILVSLGLLIFLAFRGFTLLLAAPGAAIVAAAFSQEPILAKWTLTFMQGTGGFIISFFPLFLLGGVFGKLMDDSGAALSIARGITEQLGEERAVMSVVLASAALTYGGVSLFVVAFVAFPVAAALFRQAEVPHRLIPRGDRAWRLHLHDDGAARHSGHSKSHPNAVFRHNPVRRAHPRYSRFCDHRRLRVVVAAGDRARARNAGEGYGIATPANVDEQIIRERAANADNFDQAELTHGHRSEQLPSFVLSAAPILIVLVVNLIMSFVVLPRANLGFLAEPRFGETSLSAVSGVWSVVTALAIASLVLAVHHAQAPAAPPQDARCRRQCFGAPRPQHREPGWFRCRGGGFARLRGGARRNPVDPRRSAGVDRRGG